MLFNEGMIDDEVVYNFDYGWFWGFGCEFDSVSFFNDVGIFYYVFGGGIGNVVDVGVGYLVVDLSFIGGV